MFRTEHNSTFSEIALAVAYSLNAWGVSKGLFSILALGSKAIMTLVVGLYSTLTLRSLSIY